MPLMLPATIDIADVLANGFSDGEIPIWNGSSFEPTGDFQPKYTRVIVVDSGGKGDYTSVKDACDYVATQTHDTNNGWRIAVMPGTYTEEPFTVPSYTVVDGLQSFMHNSSLFITRILAPATFTAGNYVTLGGSSATIRGIQITPGAQVIPTGNINMVVSSAGGQTYINHCVISIAVNEADTYEICAVRKLLGTGSSYLWMSSVVVLANSGTASKAWGYKFEGGTANVNMGYCSFVPGVAGRTGIGVEFNITSSSASPFIAYCRFGAADGRGFDNYDLLVTGTASYMYVNNTPLRKVSGNIRFLDRFFTTPAGIREAPAADQTPLTIKEAIGQTALMQKLVDNADAVKQAIDIDGWYYIGDPTVDGCWRMATDGNNLVHQRLESSSWVTKQTISA